VVGVLWPPLPHRKVSMRKFRSLKYRSYNAKSPLGHMYSFPKYADTTAEFEGVFYPEDEAWMAQLASPSGGNILWEVVTQVVEEAPKKRGICAEMIHGFVPVVTPDIQITPTPEQIQAEVNLANLECGLNPYEYEVLVTPPPEVEPEVDAEVEEVAPAIEEVVEEVVDAEIDELIEYFGKYGNDMTKLLPLYRLSALQDLCAKVGLETDATKRVLMTSLYAYFVDRK